MPLPCATPSPFAVSLLAVSLATATLAGYARTSQLAVEEQTVRAELDARNRILTAPDVAPPPHGLDQPWQPPPWSWPLDQEAGSNPGRWGDFGPPVTDTRDLPLWRTDAPDLRLWRVAR